MKLDWNKALISAFITMVVMFTGWMALTTVSNTTAVRENTVVLKELVKTMERQNVDINNRVDKHDDSIERLQATQSDHETRIKILEHDEGIGITGSFKNKGVN